MPHSGSLTWTALKAACDTRAEVAELPAHQPAAAVLTCSDARLSPARRFGVPEGSLFVVRVAGNLASPEAVASLTYATEYLGVETVVVLGHDHCGAVEAALACSSDPALACIVDPIRASLAQSPACADTPCAVERNVASVLQVLRDDPGPLGDAIREGRVALHGAVIDLVTSSTTDIVHTPTSTPHLPRSITT
jgi:carbonic anhydrase